MTAHELARELLEGPDLPIALLGKAPEDLEPYVYPCLYPREWHGRYFDDWGEKQGPIVLLGVHWFAEELEKLEGKLACPASESENSSS